MIAVGIDPGKKNTGFAVWDCIAGEYLSLETLDFWTAYYKGLRLDKKHEKVFAVIENPSLNKPVFPRGVDGLGPKLRIAQNVGMNKREAQLLIKGFRRAGIPVRTVRPADSKWNADTFRNITGWMGRTSQHARDAGRLVVGLKPLSGLAWEQMKKETITEREVTHDW